MSYNSTHREISFEQELLKNCPTTSFKLAKLDFDFRIGHQVTKYCDKLCDSCFEDLLKFKAENDGKDLPKWGAGLGNWCCEQ